MNKVIVFILFFLLFPSILVSAAIIHVPGDQPTIQAGIDAAMEGDTVIVADGTYTGDGNRDIDFDGKAITVSSENGPDNCIIDSQGSQTDYHRGFYFHSGEGLDSIVQGFTIKNGFEWRGGGILCESASPTIMDNLFIENETFSDGGAIYCLGSPLISRNTITSNAADDGGGIFCWGSFMMTQNIVAENYAWGIGGGIVGVTEVGVGIIRSNVITGNSCDLNGSGGGIYCGAGGSGIITIANNIITNNVVEQCGCGISCGGTVDIINNTISGNHSWVCGGGIACSNAVVTMTNNILWDNVALNGMEIHAYASPPHNSTVINISYSDVDGGASSIYLESNCTLNWGAGMIDADPRFVTGPGGVYYLLQPLWQRHSPIISPCVDAGDPASERIYGTTRTDEIPDDGIMDMGCHYPTDRLYEPNPLLSGAP